jgi:hypothetical protein
VIVRRRTAHASAVPGSEHAEQRCSAGQEKYWWQRQLHHMRSGFEAVVDHWHVGMQL